MAREPKFLRRGRAEAAAVRARGEALKVNPNIVKLFYAESALKWDGKLPTRMIPGAALPILNISGRDFLPSK